MSKLKSEDEVRAEVRALMARVAKPEAEWNPALLRPEEVRAIRTSMGLTQEDIARELGITVRTFARWEQGGITKLGSMAMRMLKEQNQ